MKRNLKVLLEQSAYNVCRPLPCDSFIKLCKDRAIDVSKRVLERLEELGVFCPVARATKWSYLEKTRRLGNGGYERLGPLAESEDWDGTTETMHASFYFGRSDTPAWLETGRLWDPRERPFVRWDNYLEDGWQRMESYYSLFQAYELWWRLLGLRREVAAEFWVLDPDKWRGVIDTWARQEIEFSKRHFPRYDIAFVCQMLSDRYYPLTQTNNRYISIPSPQVWDWHAYCRGFDVLGLLRELNMDVTEVRNDWEMMVIDAKHCDPMENWYDLVSFVSVDKRKKLKAEALRAQTWYSMEHMLRLFYFDLTGIELPTPEGPITYKFVPGSEQPDKSHPLERLERLSHEYEIDPRPVLILLVEGESEAAVLPDMMERLFDVSLPSLCIETTSIGGVSNFVGTKLYDRSSAFVRFVDYHHSRGTIVYIILDNENSATTKRGRLVGEHSRYGRRKVTNEDYVRVWERNIEFDNFSDPEIAEALSQLAQNKCAFTAEEISEVRRSFGARPPVPLGALFQSKVDHALNKVHLLSRLFLMVSTDDSEQDQLSRRPILAIMRDVVRLARANFVKPLDWHREHLTRNGLYGQVFDDDSRDKT